MGSPWAPARCATTSTCASADQAAPPPNLAASLRVPYRMRYPLLAILISAAALLSAATAAFASPFMISVVQDDNNLIYSNASSRAVTLNKAKNLGADAVRVTILWNAVAGRKRPHNGANPASYRAANWDKY